MAPFFFSKDKSRWKNLMEQPEISPCWKDAIQNCLMKHKIDIEKWAINIDCLGEWNVWATNGRLAAGGLDTIIDKYGRNELPSMFWDGLNDWFLAGFPDVAKWWICNEKNAEILVYEMKKRGSDSDYYNSDDTLKIHAFNTVIDIYQKQTHYGLQLCELNRYSRR